MLKVKERDLDVSNNKLRKMGVIPAVYYSKDESSKPLQLSLVDFNKDLRGNYGIINLSDGNMAIVREVQKDPVSNKILHVSFQGVTKGEMFQQDISVVVTCGEKPSWNSSEMYCKQELSSVTVETTPDKLPECISVDVTSLGEDEKITVADLKTPEGVTILDEGDKLVAHLVYSKKEEEPEEETVEGDPDETIEAESKESES